MPFLNPRDIILITVVVIVTHILLRPVYAAIDNS